MFQSRISIASLTISSQIIREALIEFDGQTGWHLTPLPGLAGCGSDSFDCPAGECVVARRYYAQSLC
jgi:hypothetical protein